MYIPIGRPKSLKDIQPKVDVTRVYDRSKVKILVIDDEDFIYLNGLRDNGFSIRYVSDGQMAEIAEAYDIVICDVQGVAKNLSERKQGAHLIKEMKLIYPFKTVIAYTGKPNNAAINRDLRKADDLYGKDLDLEDLLDNLDREVRKFQDVKTLWKRLRDFLISNNVDTYTIARLEDKYVEIINKGGNMSDFSTYKHSKSLQPDVRAVIQSFVASAIFAAITGTP